MTPLNVHTLTCHRHVPMAARCLGSLLKMSDEPVALTIHDDGTLTDRDVESLSRTLPGSTFRRRGDIDSQMEDALTRYPLSRAFRRSNPLGLKLLDPFYLDSPETFRYCDCDVLFLRPFHQLFELPGAAGALVMQDHRQSYSIRSWTLAATRGLELAAGVNSGMLVYKTRHYDPELIEWFLSLRGLDLFPFWKEQTAWAMLARRAGAWSWDKSFVRVMKTPADMVSELVAGHFVPPARSLLPRIKPQEGDPVPAEVRTVPMPKCGPAVLFADELRRKLERIFQQ
jgi:hypothetical protein